MMLKRTVAIAITCLVIAVLAAATFVATPVKLVVNGRELSPDVPPQLVNGRTMVPVRWVAEALGARVQWDNDTRTVRIEFGLPEEVQDQWEYPRPDGGELTLGYLGRRANFLLPVVATLNSYLAQEQVDSLYPAPDATTQVVLTRYELLDSGRTDGGMSYSDDGAYRIASRLYYTEYDLQDGYMPYTVRAHEQVSESGSIGGAHDSPIVLRSWYEDVEFTVHPNNNADVIEGNVQGRTIWVKGAHGWYVDEDATTVITTTSLQETPTLFDYPAPPAGYEYGIMPQR